MVAAAREMGRTAGTLTRGTGWVRDLPDPRDHKLLLTAEQAAAVPDRVDLRPDMPPVLDQGQLGSCTGNAWAIAYDHERKREGRSFIYPSRLFIYYNERVLENTTQSDAGATIRSGIKTLVADGACPESMWPYNVDYFRNKPPEVAYTAGLKAQAVEYMRVDQTVSGLMGALSLGYVVVFGFLVYQQFMELDRSGIVTLPRWRDQPLGGHAGALVGYVRNPDNGSVTFIDQNSWGTRHGDYGHAYFPSAYLTNNQLAADFWCVKLIEPDEPPPPPPPPNPTPPDPTPTPIDPWAQFYVGPAIKAAMIQRGCIPLCREDYPVNHLGDDLGYGVVLALNVTAGTRWRYTYVKANGEIWIEPIP